MKNLVIVESPTKARVLTKFLGAGYEIDASMGHIRDLPKSEMGVDTEHNFEPKYVVPKDKKKKVAELKKLALEADNLWLATDPDREGEAIAWHIYELLKNEVKGYKSNSKSNGLIPVKRVVFHEITPEAVQLAFKEPRDIDLKLVDAQQARRVLDRLVGYKLSPLLWKKVKSGLSAGRVQSVGLRLVVEREQEIQKFKPQEYWSILADFLSVKNEPFQASLVEVQGKKVEIKNQEQSQSIVESVQKAQFKISRVVKKQVKKYPAPPFTTSTLQQAAANRLGMSAKKTMNVAQYLYEHGLITYMRTDSMNLSTSALSQARKYIEDDFGKAYLPPSAKVYKTKSKMAQEAHEAIRPTNVSLTSDQLKSMEGLTRDHTKIYDLIWKRMVASQMNEAIMDQTSVDVMGTVTDGDISLAEKVAGKVAGSVSLLFRATGSILKFEGWLKLYGKNTNQEETDSEDGEAGKLLPELAENEKAHLSKVHPEQHFTEPPPRYNDASLIKKLEELGIGRPSTYAPTLSTLTDRYYIERKEKRFFPTELGVAVNQFLMDNFSDIVDYSFTAQMENELDEVASGEREWKPIIANFYQPFAKKIEQTSETAEKVKIATEVVDKQCPKCGKNLVVRFGKFGKFYACSGFPECKYTESIEEKVNAVCPEDGGEIVMRKTRKGKPFYGCKNWPTCKFASWTKPK